MTVLSATRSPYSPIPPRRMPICLRIRPGNGALNVRRPSRTGSSAGIRWAPRIHRTRGRRVRTTDRLRKNVTSLSAQEIETVRTAFTGIMERPPDEADSYFALAGNHGLPQSWCLHHEDRFSPWHRVYLKLFEDALRSVPGRQLSATSPDWDVTTPLPDLLQKPPFASYALPQDPGVAASPPEPGAYFPYTTERYPPAEITQNLQDYGVPDDITTSLGQSRWGAYNTSGYQDFSIQAHDGGHASVGPTMADQNVSSYDPVFWFYHCNIDRLWLRWQHNVQATTPAASSPPSTATRAGCRLRSTPCRRSLPTADETITYWITYDRRGTGGHAGEQGRKRRGRARVLDQTLSPGLGAGQGHRPAQHPGIVRRQAAGRWRADRASVPSSSRSHPRTAITAGSRHASTSTSGSSTRSFSTGSCRSRSRCSAIEDIGRAFSAVASGQSDDQRAAAA